MRHPRAFCRALALAGAVAACAAARPAAAAAGGIPGKPGGGTTSSITCTPSNVLLNFGAYNVLSGATLGGVGTITVSCTRSKGGGAPVSVYYTASLALPSGRQMAPPTGSDLVLYQVYQDAAYTTVWGNTPGVDTITRGPLSVSANSTVTDTFSVYGLITPGGQDVSAASPAPPPTTYSQNLTITVTCTPSPPC